MSSLQSTPPMPPPFISDSKLVLAPPDDDDYDDDYAEDSAAEYELVRTRDTPEIQALREALVVAALDAEARRPLRDDDACRLSRICSLRADIFMLHMWPARACPPPRTSELLKTLGQICCRAVAPEDWPWLLARFEERAGDLKKVHVF